MISRVSTIIIFLCLSGVIDGFCSENKLLFDDRLKKFAVRQTFIDEGNEYVLKLDFDRAILKFEEACKPEYLTEESEKSWPYVWWMKALFYKGDISEALALNALYSQGKRNSDVPAENKTKFEALLKLQETGNKQPVYDFVESYKRKYKAFIPPKRADQMRMSTIAELYDLIGDYDAGIQWAKMFRKADKSEPLKRTRKEYDRLIQAFEESKEGQPKVCSEDGKYCVGRATAVIIRSEYF